MKNDNWNYFLKYSLWSCPWNKLLEKKKTLGKISDRQLFVGKQFIRVMFKRLLSVGLSDKHSVENDFLYSKPEKRINEQTIYLHKKMDASLG